MYFRLALWWLQRRWRWNRRVLSSSLRRSHCLLLVFVNKIRTSLYVRLDETLANETHQQCLRLKCSYLHTDKKEKKNTHFLTKCAVSTAILQYIFSFPISSSFLGMTIIFIVSFLMQTNRSFFPFNFGCGVRCSPEKYNKNNAISHWNFHVNSHTKKFIHSIRIHKLCVYLFFVRFRKNKWIFRARRLSMIKWNEWHTVMAKMFRFQLIVFHRIQT